MSLAIYSVLLLSVVFWPHSIHGHGRLIEPPSRASAWRYGFNTPQNFNDHELFCGGFTRQWVKNGGKCGVCGDPWDAQPPRAHEYGGTYGQGVIVRKYTPGSSITIRVELTANHFGYFEFGLCSNFKTPTQQCFDENRLKLIKPQDGVEHKNYRYFPKDGNRIYEIRYRLPTLKICEHCVLQWRYIAGNNWGNCPNGTGAVGCGPQEEFRACADITITGKGDEMDDNNDENTIDIDDNDNNNKPDVPTVSEQNYSPITALILSLVTFLIVFLILSLLYIHFYQVGRRVKAWLKKDNNSNNSDNNNGNNQIKITPKPPPRLKRNQSRDDLHEIDLKTVSLA